jgi:trafficking protein particle complex subunit 10
VTVEYHDPSGVFPLISTDLASRLPLRNLQWRSPTRPLRQIGSLHLEFVQDNFTRTSLRPPAQRTDSDGRTSFDIVRSGIDLRKNAVKERRHQIPGLQTSPYLKLYILRSDDKDTYKATERKKIKEWIRDTAPIKSKGKSENHDAFEWMIVHVVIPDTTASSEPRWRELEKDSDELKERKAGMKLPGKSTRTVFDKLRKDFNESAKSGQDRVAQIRLTRAQVSADILPTPAMATTIEETAEEREKAWGDLMGKVRTGVLESFDLRVREYEKDVAEQESRRAMPGFNFCTFFIYKEGLAKAFEGIGLVEDALVIYDELSLGFETVLKDIARGQTGGSATTFAPYTSDIIERVAGSSSSRPNTNGAKPENSGHEGNSFQKDYRERIVRSDISVFDFSCYLFARQNALILRVANAAVSQSSSRSALHETEDLVLISEVCWRAANFIHNAARSLRQDLHAYRASQWEKQIESPITEADVESIVCSWTYSLAGQMLDETYSPILETMTEPGRREVLQNGTAAAPKHRAVASLGGVNAHPQRTTSLPARKSRKSELQGRDSLQSASESDLMSPPMSPGSDGPRTVGPQAGLLELVTYRAELLLIQRKMLEQVAKQRKWVAGWALMEQHLPAKMEEIDLNAEVADSSEGRQTNEANVSDLLAPALSLALESKDTFLTKYEALSEKAMRLLLSATQSKRAESIMGDLAILKYQQSDYGYAASYFQHVLPFYSEEGWSLMEVEALRMHSMCLKELGRKEEYVVTLLALAAKACGWRKEQNSVSGLRPTFDEFADVSGVLPEALEYSANLDIDVSNSAGTFFSNIVLQREILHNEKNDGFSLTLELRHLLDDEVPLDRISARLVSIEDPNLEIWLSSSNITLHRGLNEVRLSSPAVAYGPFVVERIVLQANKVLFVHEVAQDGTSDAANAIDTPDTGKQPLVFLYPGEHAFNAQVSVASNVQIDQTRHLQIRLRSGWNDVQSVDVKLRPATAGLRLHLADATCEGIYRVEENEQPGHLSLGDLESTTEALLQVPYTLEQTDKDILVRLEATYRTTEGAFTYLASTTLSIQLPLDVDVNDLFRTDFLLSIFTVRTTRQMPVVITDAECTPSAIYNVTGPEILPMPIKLFQQQPAKLIYQLTKTDQGDAALSKKDAFVTLKLQYVETRSLISWSIQDAFDEGLKHSSYNQYRRILLPFLLERSRRLISSKDVEIALLLREIQVPSYDRTGWNEVVATLPTIVQLQLREWLSNWHQKHDCIRLDIDSVPVELQCTMQIPVEVPFVDFVHDASLDIISEYTPHAKRRKILALGRMAKATLTVKTSSLWANKASSLPVTDDEEGQGNRFVYDIQADPDCWLVGGLKRGNFSAAHDSKQSFDVLLMPLKLGVHPLPTVDIRAAHTERGPDAEDGSSNEVVISCETYYASAGQVVQVIRGSTSSRIFVPEVPDGGPSSRPTSKDAG